MRSTPDVTPSGTFLWIAHLVDYMSKQRMLAAMENRKPLQYLELFVDGFVFMV